MNTDAQKFSAALIKALVQTREFHKISKLQLAEKSGLSRRAIQLIEKGERKPSMENIHRLVTAMDVDFYEFVQSIKQYER